MQQHHSQGCIMPAENQADVSECAHLNKGEAKQESGHATRRHEPQSMYGEVNGASSSECSDAEEDEESHDPESKVGDSPYADPDRLSILWATDQETVLMHSSQVSLERTRTRLEMPLLGVSEAIRVLKACSALQYRASSCPVTDFPKKALAADHALRRSIGEAFVSFAERDAARMVNLCSLADKGVTASDELVRNAITSQQWQHDIITALWSLAVSFLHRPEVVMASYGHSVNHIVQSSAAGKAELTAAKTQFDDVTRPSAVSIIVCVLHAVDAQKLCLEISTQRHDAHTSSSADKPRLLPENLRQLSLLLPASLLVARYSTALK
ncbi:hypothetical protein CGC21_20575 [Leishmania donovani]|uniref:Uncharacterized protein n=1 Tax=Leishmania donovani TaxID=5661 RepID=A0A504X3W1_LEIDO|nr:hypothetical protein CGC21_20575 [Leishmania donovani]